MPEVSELVSEFGGRDAALRLLTYATRYPKVASLAVSRIQPNDFDPMTEHDLQIIWTVAQAYWQAYSSVPTFQYMIDTTCSVLVHAGYREQQFHTAMQETLFYIYGFNGPWDENYGVALLEAFCAKRFAASLGQISVIGESNVQRMAELVTTQFRRYHVTREEEIDPFDLDKNIPSSKPRIPTGVGAVDYLLGGGLSSPECYGILGPTGGGKTLMALQLAASLAERGQHVLYYTYEQPAKELQPRLLSCVAKIDRELIDGKNWDKVDSATQDAIAQASAVCRGNLSIIDRSSEGDNILEIEERIQRAIDADKKPALIVIDWMWILVTRMMASQSGRREDRKIQLDVIERFKSMAAKYDVSFLLLQQLSTEAAKKGGGSKPQWFNSAEAGNFAWLLAYCFAIGTADGNGICFLVGSKARNAGKNDVILQLDGARNRFVWKNSDMTYTWDKRRRSFVSEDKQNTMGEVDESPPEPDAEQVTYEGGEGSF